MESNFNKRLDYLKDDMTDRIDKHKFELKSKHLLIDGKMDEKIHAVREEFNEQVFELRDIMGAHEVQTTDGDKILHLEEEIVNLTKKVEELHALTDRKKTDKFLNQVQKDIKTCFEDFASYKVK